MNIGGDHEIGRPVRRCVCLSVSLCVYTACHTKPAGTVAFSCENYIGGDYALSPALSSFSFFLCAKMKCFGAF